MEKHSQRSIHPNLSSRQVPWLPSPHQQLPHLSHSRPYRYFFLLVNSLLGFFIWLIIVLCFQVYGPSMLPTLNLTGDVLLVEHVSHRFQKVGPGDVVLVRSPLDPTKMVTKRIVGMEGDQINFLPDPSITDICRTIMVWIWYH